MDIDLIFYCIKIDFNFYRIHLVGGVCQPYTCIYLVLCPFWGILDVMYHFLTHVD